MKLFKGLFNRKKKLSKYKNERVKLLKFENDLTDVVPVSYNGLFSVLDSSNAGSLNTINKLLNRKLDTLKMNIKLQNKINNRWKNMPLKTA